MVQEYMMRAEFSLPSITDEEATPEKKAPIRVKFEIPYFTVSGIQVSIVYSNLFLLFTSYELISLWKKIDFIGPNPLLLLQVLFVTAVRF